ncbi:MAG: hypothetical protein JST21_08255 [Bacteroidetes bacterium]|nr:hypothetical protein [Bacteroidota bacterium]
MKALLLVLFCCISGFTAVEANSNIYWQPTDKTEYYRILKAGSLAEINNELAIIESSSLKNKDAYAGALLMKKAGQLKTPREKLSNFKKGAKLLEAKIEADPSNTEYRFLRLIIQEHAPKITKYNNEIIEDASFIKKNYRQLDPEVLQALKDYIQDSKILKPQDFQS